MSKDYIVIRGAKEHNLKSINLEIPRNALVVITGVSGSGKSSLAFDTIYAEGQRRYVESLSAYARQFLEQLDKPNVEFIEGLSPAISIEQRTAGSNPRSTVGTQTEIYNYLRLLFARIGVVHCFRCGRKIEQLTAEAIVDKILSLPRGSQIYILAPLVRGQRGDHRYIFKEVRKEVFVRVRVNNIIYDLSDEIRLDKRKRHNIEVIVDRLTMSSGIKRRITDSVEIALKVGKGIVIISLENGVQSSEENPRRLPTLNSQLRTRKDFLFSELYACIECGISYGELDPKMFSFNSPYGACPICNGLGTKMEIDPDLVIPDKDKPIIECAIEPWSKGNIGYPLNYKSILKALADRYGFSLNAAFKDLKKEIQTILLYGTQELILDKRFEGVIPPIERLFRKTNSAHLKNEIAKFMNILPCTACKDARLKQESLAVKIKDKSIWDITKISIKEAKGFFCNLNLSGRDKIIAHQVLKGVRERLDFMINVGLDYLTLDRRSSTLSGGETQRIRLANQIGAGLVGVIYILDEPSIGLHQKDNARLLDTLEALRDLGNTVIVVEHDEATIRSADHIIDLGVGAGRYGGEVITSGTLKDLLENESSLTGKYLRGELKIDVPEKRRSYRGKLFLEIKGAREHNLKDIDVKIPLGLFVCITGVSGSGKSTLVDEILYRALAQLFYRSKVKPGAHQRIVGASQLDKVIIIDQSPIGRTPRSNPATYTGVFTHIRELFSKIHESRLRGYRPGRFSFNVKGGRCEECCGDGIKRIEMHFLPDVWIRCEVCKGKRYNRQTLEVKYKGKSIADVLKMSVDEALDLFRNIPKIKNKLQVLNNVGLGYIELGQSATTLSGGEAQRVKLATELSRRSTGRTLYILDEPTTGLHFADIARLLKVLQTLVDLGNTVLVIEHNLEVIKCADYIIDLGPEGGDDGGRIVSTGTPEELMEVPRSYTGFYLRNVITKT